MEQPDVKFGDQSLELVGKFVYVGGGENSGRLIILRKKEAVFDLNAYARTALVKASIIIGGDPDAGLDDHGLMIRHPDGGNALRVNLSGAVVIGGSDESPKNHSGGDGSVSIRRSDGRKAIDLQADDRHGDSRITLFAKNENHKKAGATIVIKSDGTVWVGGPGAEGSILVWSENTQNYVDLTAVVTEHRLKINKLEAQVAMLMEALG